MPKMSEMRKFVMNLYPDRPWWHNKVWNMPTRQVAAIYKTYKDRKVPMLCPKEPEGYHQIDMFEYMATLTQNYTEVNV